MDLREIICTKCWLEAYFVRKSWRFENQHKIEKIWLLNGILYVKWFSKNLAYVEKIWLLIIAYG